MSFVSTTLIGGKDEHVRRLQERRRCSSKSILLHSGTLRAGSVIGNASTVNEAVRIDPRSGNVWYHRAGVTDVLPA